MEFFKFDEHPGNLYVVATLLPLASFVLLLLAGALRALLRANGISDGARSLLQMLGGEKPAKWPAYVATGAIAGAFVLCLIGFILHYSEQSHHGGRDHTKPAGAAHDHDRTEPGKEKKDETKEHDHAVSSDHGTDKHDRWAARLDWARVLPEGPKDTESGTLLQLGYKIDTLSSTMFLMVTFIATLIHIFSIGYMSDELESTVEDHQVHTDHGHFQRRGRYGRFFMFLSLFCFSMLNLILADNLFQVFLSWELVGICSYLLIGFYYERTSAANAANKAFITNRVGDAGFIIGLLILWSYVGTLNFDDMFKRVRAPEQDSHGGMALAGHVVRADIIPDSQDGSFLKARLPDPGEKPGSEAVLFPREVPEHWHGLGFDKGNDGNTRQSEFNIRENPEKDDLSTMPYWLLVVAGLGIFLGCVGKSAQFPLQVWLPDAMEGPTPVSALIHAATMVAAGVYLVGRCYPLFTPESRLVIAYTGGITLFVAASVALVMTDIKKVLAYSTVSQLGYMMLALGVGGWAAGLFHLVTHAFFKALLFLGSGSVIYGCHHEQEMTKMGGLKAKMPITAYTMLMGVFAIMGFPCTSGWYSKDAVLASALGFVSVPENRQHFLLFLLPLVTAGITTFYMFRMWFMTFTGKPRDHDVYDHAHETPRVMTIPLIILAVFSIIVAWGWPIWDAEASALEHHLHHSQHASVVADLGMTLEEQQEREHENLELWHGKPLSDARRLAEENHSKAGFLAITVVLLGFIFAWLMYYKGKLDPAEAQEQFPGVHRFLQHKWYFDEFYSVALVRPALVVAHWFRAFDTYVIDGIINFLGRFTVLVSKWDGLFDAHVVDGLVNFTSTVVYAVGGRARRLQTGYLRSYVLFLVLAAVGIFAVLSYFVARVMAHSTRAGLRSASKRETDMEERDVILMSVVTFLPIVFATGLLFFPKKSVEYMRWWSLLGTAATLLVSLFIFIDFQHMTETYSAKALKADALLPARADAADREHMKANPPKSNDWVAKYPWVKKFNIDYYMGLDGISMALLLLTTSLSFLAMWASWKIDRYVRGYCMLFLLLETGMVGTFLSLDFFLFYIFWEVMLLPMYFLIGVWGGPRREYAAIKFFLYTLLGSVLILIALLAFYFTDVRDFMPREATGTPTPAGIELSNEDKAVNSFDLIMLQKVGHAAAEILRDKNPDEKREAVARSILQKHFTTTDDYRVLNAGTAEEKQRVQKRIDDQVNPRLAATTERLKQPFFTSAFQITMFLLLFIGFAIKVPVFPFHTWLPDAHVEAPTPISMILAGVLLKLGGYGIIRIAYPICPWAAETLAWWVGLFGIINIVYGAFAAMAQTDFKKLVAYSSVSHMGYVILGIAVWTAPERSQYWSWGMNGAMFQMIAHGITSAGMFFLVGVIYDRAHHRNLDNFRGLYEPMPLYGGMSAVIFFAAMGLPGMCGFVGEFMVILSTWNYSKLFAILAALTVVITAAYILWTVQRVFFGQNPAYKDYKDMTWSEGAIAALFIVPAVALGVLPNLLLAWMEPSVSGLVESLARLGP